MKNILISLIFVLLGAALPIITHASNIRVVINGERVTFDGQQPVIVDGRVMVPVRGVFEKLGFNVIWNPSLQQATLTDSTNIVILTVGSSNFTANGAPHNLDVPAQSIGGSVMLPIRAVLESVGYEMIWHGQTNTVEIFSTAISLVVNGTEWDLDEVGIIEVGGVIMVPVDVLVRFGIDKLTGMVATPNYRAFRLRNMSVYIYEKQADFWVWRDNPERANSRNGTRRIRLDMPTLVYNGIMYIPIRNLVEIASEMNNTINISLDLPLLPPTVSYIIRGQDADLLWEEYEGKTVLELVDTGYSRSDIIYVLGRIQQDNRIAVQQERFLFAQLQRSTITLPNRRLTEAERQEWISDYLANGGPTENELAVLRYVNIERVNHGLVPVEIDDTLMMAARFYAQQISNLREAGIPAPLGHNVGPYADRPGEGWYPWGASFNVARAFGANLRWGGGNGHSGGITSAGAVVYAWMNSEGHRRYILSPEHRFMGFGQFPGGISYLFLAEMASTPR